jgi:segregation and condensation protein B
MLEYEEIQKREHLKRVVEALLFATNEPIPLDKIREITDTIEPYPPKFLRSLLQELQMEYRIQNRAFRLEEIAQGFVLRSCEEFNSYIALLQRNKRAEKLSNAAAEVLAIIAYRQPITKPQVEAIRGVDSSSAFQVLLERQLIQPAGKLEAAGRPTLYTTTREFLQHFGLRDVRELPPLINSGKETLITKEGKEE